MDLGPSPVLSRALRQVPNPSWDGIGGEGTPVREASGPPASSQLTRVPDAVITVSAPSARLLSVKNSARYLGVSTWVVWGLIHNGTLKPTVIPGYKRTLIDREQLDARCAEWRLP